MFDASVKWDLTVWPLMSMLGERCREHPRSGSSVRCSGTECPDLRGSPQIFPMDNRHGFEILTPPAKPPPQEIIFLHHGPEIFTPLLPGSAINMTNVVLAPARFPPLCGSNMIQSRCILGRTLHVILGPSTGGRLSTNLHGSQALCPGIWAAGRPRTLKQRRPTERG